MKVVHLTGKDYFGAGRAAYRLHKGLQQVGVDSVMLVGDKKSDDATVVNIQNGWFNKLLKKILIRLEKHWLAKGGRSPEGMFSTGIHALSVVEKVRRLSPDLVHIHWINRGFMKLSDLKKLNVPVLITMHDMWYFTGGCHYALNCDAFYDKCGQCPRMHSTDETDASTMLQNIKQKEYDGVNLNFIAPSTWMLDQARQSSLLRNHNVVNLPNGIDEGVFRYKPDVKQKLGLPADKKLVLFGAVDATSDKIKGFSLLNKALCYLNSNEYELIVLGGAKQVVFENKDLKVHNIGFVEEDGRLVQYLSAADVVVVPSLAENLSNMIMESLACSRPVVAFATGGNADMIRHQENGYLAVKGDCYDLANGIRWCTSDIGRHLSLCENARKTVLECFSINDISDRHLSLYKQIIRDSRC